MLTKSQLHTLNKARRLAPRCGVYPVARMCALAGIPLRTALYVLADRA